VADVENGQVEVHKASGLFSEIGTSGMVGLAGYPREEFLPKLEGTKATEVYREMDDNDPVVGGVMFVVEYLLRQIEWFTAPNEDNPASEEHVDFVESCFGDMSFTWEDTLSAIVSFLPQGWSWFEEVYKKRVGPTQKNPQFRSKHTDGRIGWRKFAFRPQWTRLKWQFDNDGGIQALVQSDPQTFQEHPIPIDKSLLFRTTAARGGPEGRSILRRAYRPYYFKKNIEEIEAIGIERDLAGMPIMYTPARLHAPTASAADKAAMEEMKRQIRNIRSNEQLGMIIPQQFDEHRNPLYKFELASTGSRRVQDTDKVIGRYDQRISMVALADFILLGHEAVGSKALSVSKVGVFETALTSFADVIADVINRFANPRLMELNGINPVDSPELRHGPVSQIDFEMLVGALERLAKAGAPLFPNLPLLKHLFGMANLPDEILEELDRLALEEEEVVPIIPPPGQPPLPGTMAEGETVPPGGQPPVPALPSAGA
jgi:hypothetical protein